MRDKRRLPRGLLGLVALGGAGWCLAGALLILLPAPGELLSFAGVALTEFSLVLTAASGIGLAMAAMAGRRGSRAAARVTAVVSAGALVVSFAPLVNGLWTATEQGVTLSPLLYLPRSGEGMPSESVTYLPADGSSDSRRLDVWLPGGGAGAPGRRDPAVVVVHGGGWDQGSRGGGHLPGWLARRGYVVFDIDYHLATPTGPSWQRATGDVKCAIGWVRAHAARYGVDPERIGLLGSSAGGHLALLTAYAGDEPRLPGCGAGDTTVKAVAALYPATDLAAFYRADRHWWNRSPNTRALLETFVGGTPALVPDRYRIASPISHVDRDVPATLLAHGGRDHVVPISQSLLLAERLRHVGAPHRLVRLRGSGHGFDLFGGGWNTQTTLATLDDFLRTWLAQTTPR